MRVWTEWMARAQALVLVPGWHGLLQGLGVVVWGAGAAATGPGTGTAVFDGATSLLPDGPPETLGCRLGTSLGGRVDGALQLSQSDAAGEEVEDEGVLEPVVVVVVVGSCFIANLSRLLRVRPGCFG